jgi:copper resistance protein B
LVATAQTAPASSSTAAPMDMGSMPGMDHSSMPGMAMPAPSASAPKPANPMPVKKAKKHSAKHPPPTPASANNAMPGMDSMPGMDHGSMPSMAPSPPASASSTASGQMSGMDSAAMAGMKQPAAPGTQSGGSGMTPGSMPGGAMRGMDHGGMSSMKPMSGMSVGPMQGGSPPPNARSPDYSNGVGYGPAHGLDMAMDDNAKIGMLLLDQLEAFHAKDGNGQSWEAEGWYGSPSDKLWLRTEGQRSGGKLDGSDAEAFWNHTVATYWSTQLGARHEFGGPGRNWAAFGIQGLAPYWFQIVATGYVGPSGRTAARFRAEYELFLTQRWILQPEFEANLYGKSDPARHLGSGSSDADLGIRLRYEIRRQFAPYVGVVWTRRFGGTADFARGEGQGIFDRQWAAGVRIWF